MTDDNAEHKKNRIKENLEAVGQMIIGEIETVGGILTADPITQAEGEYNVETGILHQESNKVLTAIEQNDDHFEQSAEAKDSGQN